jgi:Arm DNA-binding domain
MDLTDTFIRNVKPTGAPSGDKHSDGLGMYLLVNAAGKYWRLNYRFADKRKTLALGACPAVSLAKAKARRDKARELLADGIDPSSAKREDKQAQADAAANTFEAVARDWLAKTAADRQSTTHDKVTAWLNHDVFPFIGKLPIAAIGPRDVLAALRKMEARGALDSVQWVKQVCGQVFRYAAKRPSLPLV